MVAEEHLICSKCGNPRSVCSDPAVQVWPQRSTCYVTAGKEQASRKFHALADGKSHAEAGKAAAPKTYRAPSGQSVLADGTHVWAATLNLTPNDDFI